MKYSFRQSKFSNELFFELEKEALKVQDDQQTSLVPYSDVSKVSLKFHPSRVALFKAECTLFAKGEVYLITNAHFKGFGDFEDRSDHFIPFIEALHQRLSKYDTRFVNGLSPGLFVFYILLVIASVVMVAWALISFYGFSAGAILVKLLVFGYMVFLSINYFKRNKPGHYDPLQVRKYLTGKH